MSIFDTAVDITLQGWGTTATQRADIISQLRAQGFEKGLPRLIFMSGGLRDALKAEKLHVPFKFSKCRVVGE